MDTTTPTAALPVASASEPTVGLALGAGGARGFAHIVVLEVFDELGIRPNLIAGSSMGALIGSAYAAGMSGREIRDYTLELADNRSLVLNRFWGLRPSTIRDALGGFRLGQFNLPPLLRAFLPPLLPKEFLGLQIPLKVIATDYYGQRELLCESGDLFEALAASAAIPALFAPVVIHGRLMIDGGIFNPVPYDHLVGHSDILVAVDVIGAPEGDGSLVPSRMDSLFGASQLMMQSHVALKMKLCRPDIYIKPEVNTFRVLDFFKARQVLEVCEALKEPLKRDLSARVEDFLRH
ncbi:patatin-like phospholipase family protein [Peteryoungia ipomoeae]|uniref:Patatin-like phospholipase family protein n=1 Tax=Peteryoungia ipomoeae TaxID=1210932 RepID=A0A4S8NZS8_9HYPH|nr:patatin-like phospholipase family protein [Peteryoungia ipomoeae]THV23270.1 patatin-like phospholipase family protein [Peteryoungia ipomoeae]